jgi:K+-transporting ATPase c subunit
MVLAWCGFRYVSNADMPVFGCASLAQAYQHDFSSTGRPYAEDGEKVDAYIASENNWSPTAASAGTEQQLCDEQVR